MELQDVSDVLGPTGCGRVWWQCSRDVTANTRDPTGTYHTGPNFMWYMRTETDLRKPFELIHGTTDLLVNFCAFGVNFGQKNAKRNAFSGRSLLNP